MITDHYGQVLKQEKQKQTIMITPETTPKGPVFAETKSTEPLVAVTVMISGTTVGDVILGAGAKLRLTKIQAETLASLNPPAVVITGI